MEMDLPDQILFQDVFSIEEGKGKSTMHGKQRKKWEVNVKRIKKVQNRCGLRVEFYDDGRSTELVRA